uniref:U3 small nucleolar RNA-associated protein 22 n=1 Tax=Odontella aurita TaxID=265563 RepID=A0A7S4JAR4_9STRA|mmetsp:Transcript_42706/g.129731  ORF Transcript_42706/g.129731 Transcript_42706/m.129731 type:complete len:1077 (+) Transcript_42706:1110-4340(+)
MGAEGGGGGGNTIRHSASEGYRDVLSALSPSKSKSDLRRKAALVMPDAGCTESQTVARSAQSRLYSSDQNQNEKPNAAAGGGGDTPETLLECYKCHSPGPVFLDPTMTTNYLGRLSPSFVSEWRCEASKAVRWLHRHADDSAAGGAGRGSRSPFRALFLEGCRFYRRYDAYVRLDLSNVAFPTGGEEEGEHGSDLWGDDADDLGRYESLSRGAVRILSAALGDRIGAVRPLTAGDGEIVDASGGGGGNGSLCVPVRGSEGEMPEWAQDDAILSPLSSAGSSPLSSASSSRRSRRLVLGLRIDPDASRRLVDRGPPASDGPSTSAFVALWGEDKARLRRFRDGAIVRAALWNDPTEEPDDDGKYVAYSNDDRIMGGTVERIARHIARRHFYGSGSPSKSPSSSVQFALRDLTSLIDGAAAGSASGSGSGGEAFSDATEAHRKIMAAFDSLSDFLRKNSTPPLGGGGSSTEGSKLGLPLMIDAVEPLSPCLRYSELFPPVPHPLLGGGAGSVNADADDKGGKKKKRNKASGAVMSDPIQIQIRFEGSSKWPSDVNAMAAAKCAMLVQLAEGIDAMKRNGRGDGCSDFRGPAEVTPRYVNLGYKGYAWRISIRADQELKTLGGLRNPTPEAEELRRELTSRHVLGATHHTTIHAVHTRHPSAAAAVRLARRWTAAHMLSDAVPTEAMELMIASVYTDPAPLEPPATAAAGFVRFLRLLSTHDWARQPLIVDPQGHISAEDSSRIRSQFEAARGLEYKGGPPMYIISPNDREASSSGGQSTLVAPEGDATAPTQQGAAGAGAADESRWYPGFTRELPERVILTRASALAARSEKFLAERLADGGEDCESEGAKAKSSKCWSSVFLEGATSLRSYSVLLRVDPILVVDPGCSSTAGDFTVKAAAADGGGRSRADTPFARGMERRYLGPKPLRKHLYKNVGGPRDSVLIGFQPVESLVEELRRRFGRFAVFFYNDLAPDVIAVLWRPDVYVPQPFSAMHSEYRRPVEDDWKEDGLVIANADDVLREMVHLARGVALDVKVLDDRSVKPKPPPREGKGKAERKRKASKDEDSSSSDSEDSDAD